jgi:hypothetical protein
LLVGEEFGVGFASYLFERLADQIERCGVGKAHLAVAILGENDIARGVADPVQKCRALAERFVRPLALADVAIPSGFYREISKPVIGIQPRSRRASMASTTF